MNTTKIAAAVLEMSQALAKISTALSESEPAAPSRPQSPAQTTSPVAAPVQPAAAAAAPMQPVATAAPMQPVATAAPMQPTAAAAAPMQPAAVAAPPGSDAFTVFADQLKSILQTAPPGALNVQLGQMIERYAPGAAGQGQGGIRKIPVEQYANFLAEVRQAAGALTP